MLLSLSTSSYTSLSLLLNVGVVLVFNKYNSCFVGLYVLTPTCLHTLTISTFFHDCISSMLIHGECEHCVML